MRTKILAASLLSVALLPSHALAHFDAPRTLVQDDDTTRPVAMRADLAIKSVTLYRGRAAVTRSGTPDFSPGLYELRVGPLPEGADLDSVQARLGGSARLLDVKSETVVRPAPTSDNPRVREALAAVEAAQAKLADVERRVGNNIAAQKTIDSIAAKAASDASQAIGTALDPEKLRAQLVFLEAERERLTAAALALKKEQKDVAGEVRAAEAALSAAGGAPPVERFALVSIAVPDAGTTPVSVTYLVSNATWQPAYTVRGDPDKGTLAVEFDAVVRQATGEDWRDVALVLSTAQPTRAANPREIPPAYVDLSEPTPASMPVPGRAMRGEAAGVELAFDAAPASPAGGGGEMGRRAKIANMAADADVGGTGPAVEYRLPRPFSAASDSSAERRTRVATIDAKPDYMLVARPLVDSDVFLRARFRNESGYLLLPGNARMYLGADSIGQTALGETATGAEVELWFGKEPRVTVKRELVSKKSSESGLFSKSKGIDREYRIALSNTMTRAIGVELWDRVPVSRNADAKIELRDLSPALATDAKYMAEQRTQGLLKWMLTLPARTDGRDATPTIVSWKTRTIWPDGKTLSGDVD